jgi:hypothetical protein
LHWERVVVTDRNELWEDQQRRWPSDSTLSTPLGEKTLATRAVPLDHLAAHLDPGYEGLGQRHRAARHLLAPPPERLVEFGGVDTIQPDPRPPRWYHSMTMAGRSIGVGYQFLCWG